MYSLCLSNRNAIIRIELSVIRPPVISVVDISCLTIPKQIITKIYQVIFGLHMTYIFGRDDKLYCLRLLITTKIGIFLCWCGGRSLLILCFPVKTGDQWCWGHCTSPSPDYKTHGHTPTWGDYCCLHIDTDIRKQLFAHSLVNMALPNMITNRQNLSKMAPFQPIIKENDAWFLNNLCII